jgi:phage gp46-like protein
MDFQINLNAQYPNGGMLFAKNTDIRTSIFMSLNINKGSFFQNPAFGCLLFTIKKITEANINLAQQYCQEALAWLVQTGRATSIDVIVERDISNIYQLNIKVTAKQPNGLIISYQQFRPIGLGITRTTDINYHDYSRQNGTLIGA